MARKFVSPGVFTTEIDQSFLAAGVGAIGAAVIGRTQKGPAFTPTLITTFNEFIEKFGDLDPTMMTPYAARNYLKNSSVLTVVRTLGLRDGRTDVSNGWSYLQGGIENAEGKLLAVVHYPTDRVFEISGSGATFDVLFTSGSSVLGATASFDAGSSNYLGKVLNTDPTQVDTYGHYLYKVFEWAATGSAPFVTASLSGADTASFDYDFTSAETPWVTSQPFGNQVYNLLKFTTLADGDAANSELKVTIANVKSTTNSSVSRYGTFDVLIRSFGDTDQRQEVVESFPSCDLDPTSQNYVLRRIGDMYFTWNDAKRKLEGHGTYKNVSKRVRVELASGNPPPEALPWGFRGFAENGTVAGSSLVDLPYVQDNLNAAGSVASYTTWGVDFSQDGIVQRLKARMDPSVAPVETGEAFSLAYVSSSATVEGDLAYVYNTASYGTSWPAVPATSSVNGFTLPFAGGFDGWDLTVSDPTGIQDNAPATDIAVVSLKAAVDQVANPDEFDVNILVVPGCISERVTDYARQVCNDRADCMTIMDVTGTSVFDAISKLNARTIDDNYAACYYPDVKINDSVNTRIVQVKPSVVVLGAYAFSDRVGQVFFAPAGLNRGGLGQFDVTDVADRLTFQDRNDLYEARINPIATFPNEGIVVFGQKTLQARPSALDRVNVRRLLIYAKKTIASAAKYLLFEPNNPDTWQRFISTVNPILEKIRNAQGLVRFKVVMDSTVNTPDLVDRNIMTGKIFLQPTKAAEFIDLSFTITSSGVEFDE